MDTVGVTVVSLAEDHPVERPVELHIDPDARLLALDLDILDLGQVWLGGGPDIIIVSLSLVVIEGSEGTPLSLSHRPPAFIEQDAAPTSTMFEG